MELINHKGITNYLTILKALEYQQPSDYETWGEKMAEEDLKKLTETLSNKSLSKVVCLRLVKTYSDIFPRQKDSFSVVVERTKNFKDEKEFIKDHEKTLEMFKKKYQKTKDPKLGKAFFDYYKSYIKKFLEFEDLSFEMYLKRGSYFDKLPPAIEECRKLMTYLVKKMWEDGHRKHIPNLRTLHKHFLITETTLFKYLQHY